MRRFPPSITSEHPDYELLAKLRGAILNYANGQDTLAQKLPAILQDAIDFVIDPVRTARNRISELDQTEKTFIGLKIEHFLRDFLNAPSGTRDLVLDGIDVDVKNTISGNWMIPPETFRNEEPCLLIALADDERKYWLGLVVARDAYLGASAGNRDGKRGLIKKGMESIMWLAAGENLPPSRWEDIDMLRFRELRRLRGGTRRAATFFLENLGKPVHRSIVESLLFDQRDYMKRLRENGGARDTLKKSGVSLLCGTYDKSRLVGRGYNLVRRDEFVALED